jgi:hypothetical protein
MRHDRHFTLDEARGHLAWVTEALAALRAARVQLTDEQARRAIAKGTPENGGGHPGRQVGEAFIALQQGLAQFEQRGIVLRDLDRGLIDFPAVREGEEVYLCWVDGEADIEFWHELDAGYAGRHPL